MMAAGSCCGVVAFRRYSEPMRRPDIELSDDAARFVERHPDLIARLAGSSVPAAEAELADEQRARFRDYARSRLDFAGSDEAQAAGQQFLARFTGQ